MRANATVYSLADFQESVHECTFFIDSLSPAEKSDSDKDEDSEDDEPLPEECAFTEELIELQLDDGSTSNLNLDHVAVAVRRLMNTTGDNDEELENFKEKRSWTAALLIHYAENLDLVTGERGTDGYSDFKTTLDEVLDNPEYRNEKKESFFSNLIPESWKEWVRNLLKRFEGGHVGGGLPSVAVNVIWVVIGMAALFILILIFVKLQIDVERKKRLKLDREESGTTASLSDPESIIERARKFEESGNLRESLRFLYISFIRSLEDAGLVTYTTRKTNMEYIRELAKKKEEPGELRPMTRIYEDYWYGMRECPEDEYQKFCTLYKSCLKKLS